MNAEYKFKGIKRMYYLIIAQKQIKTSFSAPRQISGQQGSNLPK